MNGKIRLAALLTALLMLFQTIALAEVVTTVDDYNALLESRIEQFVKGTPEVQYAILMALETDEQRESMLALLSEDQCITLSNYIMSLDPPVYKTVNFTHAGPFMPPVDVSGIARMRLMRATVYSNDNTAVDNEAVYTSKVVSGNPTDGYKLRLETYVTGQTIVDKIEKSIPVDIVLVLDQSGSMANDFSGNSSRQDAMKNAVTKFISSVAEKYNADDSDHRIAIVTFGSNASKLQDWTYVDADGSNTLVSKIDSLPKSPSGATNVAAGMSQASTLLLGNGYRYTGQNTQRQKVVIVFTDGVPTTSSDFDTGVADKAIATAKNLKADGATVYSIGIFGNADPNELYGSESGNVGASWSGTKFLFWGDVTKVSIPAGNRFLNYLSSNFQYASELGLTHENYDYFLVQHEKFTITKNEDRTSTNYYLTATNSQRLNEIFQTISDNIQTGHSNIELGTETVVKDIIADSFQLPTNANESSIKVYTSDYTSTGSWTEPQEADYEADYQVTIKDNTVSVTGFNFSLYYVDEKCEHGRTDTNPDASGNFYGRKLIIEIPIEVKPGFLGGNNVPTNGAGSGVYSGDSCIETFTSPMVNVPIAYITVTAPDKNVYLLGDLTANDLKTGASAKCDNVPINLDPKASNFGLESWQNKYVNISTNLTTENGTDITSLKDLTEDTTFTLTCTISPSEDPVDGSVGDAASERSGSGRASINVFKPVMTFADSVVEYLSTYTFDEYFTTYNYKGVVWKHGESTDSVVTMTGIAPTLQKVYSYVNTDIDGDGKIIATADIPVDVAVKIGKIDVTSHVTFGHQCDCVLDPTCGWNEESGAEFLLHVKNIVADLTITKKGLDKYAYGAPEDQEMAIFTVTVETKDGQKMYTIALADDQSATIKDVLVGTDYTIAEQNGWTWRYQNLTDTKGTIVVGGTNVTITNNATNPYWLGGDNYAVNVFGTTSTGEAGND